MRIYDTSFVKCSSSFFSSYFFLATFFFATFFFTTFLAATFFFATFFFTTFFFATFLAGAFFLAITMIPFCGDSHPCHNLPSVFTPTPMRDGMYPYYLYGAMIVATKLAGVKLYL